MLLKSRLPCRDLSRLMVTLDVVVTLREVPSFPRLEDPSHSQVLELTLVLRVIPDKTIFCFNSEAALALQPRSLWFVLRSVKRGSTLLKTEKHQENGF